LQRIGLYIKHVGNVVLSGFVFVNVNAKSTHLTHHLAHLPSVFQTLVRSSSHHKPSVWTRWLYCAIASLFSSSHCAWQVLLDKYGLTPSRAVSAARGCVACVALAPMIFPFQHGF
jgi:hypothetical protein